MKLSRSTLIAVLLLVVLALVGWYAVQWYGRRGLVTIHVVALPSDATVTIDGRAAKNGVNYVKPGSHTVLGARILFDQVTTKVDTTKNGDKPVYLILGATSDEAKKWLYNHPAEQQKIEGVVGTLDAQKQQTIQDKYPILNKLPIETDHYKIDYALEGENNDQPTYTISLYAIINNPSQYNTYKAQLSQYRDEALQFMANNGVDVNSAQIQYIPNDF